MTQFVAPGAQSNRKEEFIYLQQEKISVQNILDLICVSDEGRKKRQIVQSFENESQHLRFQRVIGNVR
jgi:hypothetical protein